MHMIKINKLVEVTKKICEEVSDKNCTKRELGFTWR